MICHNSLGAMLFEKGGVTLVAVTSPYEAEDAHACRYSGANSIDAVFDDDTGSRIDSEATGSVEKEFTDFGC